MRIPVVAALIGELLLYFSAAFGPPLVLALGDGLYDTATGFAVAMGISLALGTAAHKAFRQWRNLRLHRHEALATVSLTWLSLGLIAAVPYMFCGLGFVDALFESISGLTTTGATILTDFGAYDRAFYLWRAMTQWFGGLGIIALFVVVLPRLGIAGRQLFFAEASDASGDSLRPQVRRASARLWVLYTALTALCTAFLMFSGMSGYDAVVHAFTTLSAGGFSPNGLSVAGYGNAGAEWVLIVFMLISGTSYTLLYRTFSGEPKAPARDTEFKFYYAVAIVGGLALAWSYAGGWSEESIRTGLFQSTSIISSTGFASADFNLWDDRSKALLISIMLVGGCAGSAAGGPKVVRLLIFGKYVVQTITRTLHPDAILPYKWQGNVMPGRVMRSIIALVVLYFVGYGIVGVLVVMQGVELETGFVAAIACLGNVGPAFGVAGPMGSYASFSPGVKLVLTAAMWIGRLEIVTVLALLHPDFLRTVRIRDRVPTPRVCSLRERARKVGPPALALLLAFGVTSCSSDTTGTGPRGDDDAGTEDAGTLDAGTDPRTDTGADAIDDVLTDASPDDTGAPDADRDARSGSGIDADRDTGASDAGPDDVGTDTATDAGDAVTPDTDTDAGDAFAVRIEVRDIWGRPLSNGTCTASVDGREVDFRASRDLVIDAAQDIALSCDAPDHVAGETTLSVDRLHGDGLALPPAGHSELGLALDRSATPPTLYVGLSHQWFASTGRPPRAGTRARLLMDGQEAWSLVSDRVRLATDSIHVSTWWWESDFELVRPDAILSEEIRAGNTVMALLDASEATKRVLVWDHFAAGLLNVDDALEDRGAASGDRFEYLGQENPTRGAFEWRLPGPDFIGRVTRDVARESGVTPSLDGPALGDVLPSRDVDLTDYPGGFDVALASYHQKLWIIDGDEAFVSGMNVKLADWDTSEHRVFDHRRMAFDATEGDREDVLAYDSDSDSGPRKDYAVYLTGPAVQDVQDIFASRWNLAMDDDVAFADNASRAVVRTDLAPVTGGVNVQIAATMPAPFHEYAILESHVNAIRAARDYILIEDQYWRAPVLLEAITETMEAHPDLQLVVITKPVSDWTDPGCYWTFETDRRLREAFPGRYHTLQLRSFVSFETWGIDETEGVFADIDVHSKLMIVDDRFVSVGSCNKNNRGYLYEGEANVNVLDDRFGTDARERVVANLLGVDTAPSDWVSALVATAADNAAVWQAWEDEGWDIDLDGDPLPAIYAPAGFVYPLAFDDPSECLIEPIGPDIASE